MYLRSETYYVDMFPQLSTPPEKPKKTEKEIQEEKERAERIKKLFYQIGKKKLLNCIFF